MSPPKLLDQARPAARLQHLGLRNEQAYVGWIPRFVRFHGTRHPRELGPADVRDFPTSPSNGTSRPLPGTRPPPP